MYNESIVYGYIRSNHALSHQQKQSAELTNRRALITLPSLDANSFLCREFFSTPSVVNYDDRLQSSIIHFGGSYEGIEYEWGLWIKSFEQLLQKMHWDSVVVHLQTELSGVHTFTWDSGDHAHIPSTAPLNIRCEWQHEVGFSNVTA